MTIESLPVNSILVCRVSAAPLSREAAYTSEMTSQLLFGETCLVTGPAIRKWLPVRCSYDGYEGFVLKNQFEPTTALPGNTTFTFCSDGWLHSNGKMLLPLGSVLNEQSIGEYTGATLAAGEMPVSPDNIRLVASLLLNVPYLWGGRSSFGIDCSGLTQLVYRFFGVPLPRDAWQQAETGDAIGFLQEARTGDLAFFDDDEGRIIHTGILLNDHEIIHAAGNVHIDAIDHAGIVNKQTGERTHRLRIIKRIGG
jgi:gamma-D-glutamyl-L-lysine dipeptidyl-peptidase